MLFDRTDIIWAFIIALPAMLFIIFARVYTNLTFTKYLKRYSSSNVTGARAARLVLDKNGLRHIPIEQISGKLTDYYDFAANVVRLSDDVYNGTSTVSIGVACHVVGYALQHATGYTLTKIRRAIQPAAYISFKLSLPLMLVGVLLGKLGEIFVLMTYIGLSLAVLSAVLRLAMLPTAFDAGSRALAAICENDLLTPDELKCVRKFFFFAAMTYV